MPRHDPKRDWLAIKLAYVEGYDEGGKRIAEPRLVDVGTKFGVPWGTLSRRATAEKWPDEREAFKYRMQEARREKRVEVFADEGADFNSKALKTAKALMAQVGAHLNKSAQAKEALSPDTLRKLTAAAKAAHEMGRLALGESTENTNMSGSLSLSNDDDARAEALAARLAAGAAGATTH